MTEQEAPPNIEGVVADKTHEPLFNLPPLTLGMLIVFTAIHVVRAVSLTADHEFIDWLAFMPVAFTAHPLNQAYTLVGYGLLHFGWLHFFMNMTGFMAFGSGVERWFGKAMLCFILIGGAIIGALGHWALDPQSMVLLGGASAGISALFGSLLPALATGKGYWAAIAAFIFANVAVGLVGVPTQPGLAVAWQAHLFGFAFGLAVTHIGMKRALHRQRKAELKI